MEQIKRAALAPAQPSAQDHRVASQADGQRVKAQGEAAAARAKEQAKKTNPNDDGETSAASETKPDIAENRTPVRTNPAVSNDDKPLDLAALNGAQESELNGMVDAAPNQDRRSEAKHLLAAT